MGTDDNSSKSKSTLNLNLFFFIRINDMMWDCAAQVSGWNCGGGRQPNTFSELSLLLTQLSLLCRHDSKFKSLPSHPLKHNINDAREIPRCDWTARVKGEKRNADSPNLTCVGGYWYSCYSVAETHWGNTSNTSCGGSALTIKDKTEGGMWQKEEMQNKMV